MVHGLFRASGIVMIYRLHHDFGRRGTGGISSECLGHFWRARVGQFWKAPKAIFANLANLRFGDPVSAR
jgi:hypothetical protein